MTQDTLCPICGTDKVLVICPDCGGSGFYDYEDDEGDRVLCDTCRGDGDLWLCQNEGEAGHVMETSAGT